MTIPSIAQRLIALGVQLPQPAAAVAAYVPYRMHGDMLFISGQLPMQDGAVAVTGKIGRDVTLADGHRAARLCALNILAQAQAACGGDLERITSCLKLGGFVCCVDDFTDQAKIMNGASELIEQIWGQAGKHVRFAVGNNALPLNAAVEIEAIFTFK